MQEGSDNAISDISIYLYILLACLMTFAGTLSDALEFKGALSEESTPLQPEGNTQTLRDIDRIYIELHSPRLFTATIGDFPLSLDRIRQDSLRSASRYDNLSRKVLGAMAAGDAGSNGCAAAVRRRRFHASDCAFQESS